MVIDIKHPRRILCLGGPDSGVLNLLKDLTGTLPPPRPIPLASPPDPVQQTQHQPPQTTAGLTHTYTLKNTYYEASIPIWLDEPTSTLVEWKADFLTPEGGEVVRAVGAWVVVFRAGGGGGGGGGSELGDVGRNGRWGWKEVEEAMEAVKEVIEFAHGGGEEGWDGVCLVVRVASSLAGSTTSSRFAGEMGNADYEDVCWDKGFEFVDLEASNEMGRGDEDVDGWREKKGLERVKEALEANDWSSTDDDDDDDDQLKVWRLETENFDVDGVGFQAEMHDVESDFRDLRLAMATGAKDGRSSNDEQEEALQADELEDLMRKMVMVRDMSAHMPEAERKRFAAKSVKDLLKST